MIEHGMHYDKAHARLIARALAISEEQWNTLPVTTIPARTILKAHYSWIDSCTVERVVSGEDSLREDYVTRLWRDSDGELYVVDGHVRTAIYHALNKDMPVRIMDEKLAEYITAK